MEEDLEKGFRRGEYCSTSCPHSPILVPVSKNASCLEEASINQSLNLTYFGVYTSPAATNIHYAVEFSSANGSRLVQDTIQDVRFRSPKGFLGVRRRPQPHTCLEMSRGNILYASHCPKVRSTPIVAVRFFQCRTVGMLR